MLRRLAKSAMMANALSAVSCSIERAWRPSRQAQVSPLFRAAIARKFLVEIDDALRILLEYEVRASEHRLGGNHVELGLLIGDRQREIAVEIALQIDIEQNLAVAHVFEHLSRQ